MSLRVFVLFFIAPVLFALVLLTLRLDAHASADSINYSILSSLNSTPAKPLQESIAGRARVWVFLSAKCPCSHSHVAKLKQTFEEFSSKGIEFIGVHSNQDEESEVAKNYFAGVGLGFSVFSDPGAQIADHFGALKTPHVFVESPDHRILFEGGIDDSRQAASTQANYLRDALGEIVSGKPVSRSRVRTLGCVITRKAKS